jgi:hypothetical protein
VGWQWRVEIRPTTFFFRTSFSVWPMRVPSRYAGRISMVCVGIFLSFADQTTAVAHTSRPSAALDKKIQISCSVSFPQLISPLVVLQLLLSDSFFLFFFSSTLIQSSH